ncbi:hypothetical protein LPJ63_003038 [Coemansia sp. RSA 2711]|nr:hypothetical protein LPJ63_003038 [Coemansia sp. RSA 2711]KAJ2304953.1 hypothetical protein IWW52_006503 [Coemansia sp. RSA 2704]
MDRIFKVVMVGAVASGKTSLRNYFLHRSFAWHYAPTATADFVSTNVTLDSGELAAMQIWDTGGDDTLAINSLAQDADGIALVYDSTQPESLRVLERHLASLRPRLRADAVVVAVRTKTDLLLPAVAPPESLHGDVACMDTSARTGEGVDQVFRTMVAMCLSRWRAQGAMALKPRVSRHGDPILYHRFEIDDGLPGKRRLRASGRLRATMRRLLCLG